MISSRTDDYVFSEEKLSPPSALHTSPRTLIPLWDHIFGDIVRPTKRDGQDALVPAGTLTVRIMKMDVLSYSLRTLSGLTHLSPAISNYKTLGPKSHSREATYVPSVPRNRFERVHLRMLDDFLASNVLSLYYSLT